MHAVHFHVYTNYIGKAPILYPEGVVTMTAIIKAETLKVGQRVIESRFDHSNTRVDNAYTVSQVAVGRFVQYTILDEKGESLRTTSPGDNVVVEAI